MRRHPYPRGLAPTVPGDQWISQKDAASRLDMSIWRIGFVIANDHLEMVENVEREPGVSVKSLHRELLWREAARTRDKARRLMGDILNWF